MPSRTSSSFTKPTKLMNVAAGCPMFATKDKVFNCGFIKDDSLFVKCETKINQLSS